MKRPFRRWPLYSLLGVFGSTSLFFVGGYVYESQFGEPKLTPVTEQNQAALAVTKVNKDFTAADPWSDIYPNTRVMKIGQAEVKASVAQTWSERITGLSGTPYLPADVVKFFVFDAPGYHSIWMKDMKYSIDILWVDTDLKIVYIQNDATPESYPDLFTPTTPALYVIETEAGFVEQHNLSLGQSIELPALE